MAERRTLQRAPGLHSGRIVPTRGVALEGDFVFCLGDEQLGRTGFFAHGEQVQIESDLFAFVDKSLARARLRVMGPSVDYVMPDGWSWYVRAKNENGVLRWSYPIQPGDDFVIDVSLLTELTQNPGGEFGVVFELVALNYAATEPAELSIPSVYVDNVVTLAVPGGLSVENATPVGGRVGVSRTTTIAWSLISNSGTTPNSSAQSVFVNGVAAVVGGVAQPGWTLNTISFVPGAREFVLERDDEFGSEELVTVRVQATVGSSAVDRTWSFTTVDETAPVVYAASAQDHYRVRVSFTEPVRMVDAASSDDALNPANYTFTPRTAPTVSLVATSVEPVSPFEVDVFVDIAMTPGGVYVVTVDGVEDLVGNAVVAPENEATFDGYECAVPTGRRFELWRMVGDMDRRRDETRDLYKLLAVLQEPLDLLLCDIDRWVEILDVDVAAERYVDQMLIGLGNPFEFDLDLVDKRRLVRSLIRVYQQKGTAVGIINVVRFFLGLEVTIEPYNQDGWILGESELGFDTYLFSSASFARYAFVVVSPVTLTAEQRARIAALVEYMKPAHTHHVETLEPEGPGEELTEWWDLGVSQLGLDTVLGQDPALNNGFPYTFPFALS